MIDYVYATVRLGHILKITIGGFDAAKIKEKGNQKMHFVNVQVFMRKIFLRCNKVKEPYLPGRFSYFFASDLSGHLGYTDTYGYYAQARSIPVIAGVNEALIMKISSGQQYLDRGKLTSMSPHSHSVFQAL
jgi:hypothetical protein